VKSRLNFKAIVPGAYEALATVERYLNGSSLERPLKNLVVMRASQLNHCAFCIDLHSKELRAAGETEQRIYLLDAWREAPFYTPRERAALAWTEAVTILAPGYVPDDVFEEASREFGEAELVNLTLAIAAINAWNRLSIAFRTVPR
jgi:AhpD family alkylhydroperoxidase